MLLAAICTIGARGLAPDLYDKCLKEFYTLAQEALLEPAQTLETLKGILLMSVWHKNSRFWGLALSISYQMGLPEIALSLGNEAINLDETSIDQARTWLSFCCMDLGYAFAPLFQPSAQKAALTMYTAVTSTGTTLSVSSVATLTLEDIFSPRHIVGMSTIALTPTLKYFKSPVRAMQLLLFSSGN